MKNFIQLHDPWGLELYLDADLIYFIELVGGNNPNFINCANVYYAVAGQKFTVRVKETPKEVYEKIEAVTDDKKMYRPPYETWAPTWTSPLYSPTWPNGVGYKDNITTSDSTAKFTATWTNEDSLNGK